ncbi:MAG: rhomboid family intramembrane serine protease [Bermanella sp.]
MPLAIICDPDTPIEPVIHELVRQNVAHELKENGTRRELWVDDPALVDGVKKYYQTYRHSQQHSLSVANLRSLPITTAVLVVTLVVALLTQLGEQRQDWFLMARLQYYPRDWFLYDGLWSIWHAISPIFLHFSAQHLIFNGLMFWYLGGLLERATGRGFFVIMLLVLALAGNVSQLLVAGPLFGGLSGVVYGFMGFACVYQLYVLPLGIAKGLFYLAGVWLLLGISGVFSAMGLFSVANAAHLGGLLSGLVMSGLYVARQRLRVKDED